MSSEKTPVLLSSKLPYDDYERDRKDNRSVSLLTWIFIAILIALMVILVAQFFYWPFDRRITSWEEMESAALTNTKITVQEISKQEVASSDPWNFGFLIDPPDLCATRNPPNSAQYANDPEVKLLILVPSAVDHFEQRKAIRRTWGSMAERPYGPTRLGFVLGTTSNRTVDHLVQDESSQYRDIIQADFVDGYNALTTKGILMLKWVAQRCPHAQYFLKTEDDTFVNLGNVVRILGNEPHVSRDKFISGYVQRGGGVPQKPSTKALYLTIDDYPDLQFTPYVSSSAYIMTIPTALDLFDASRVVQPLLPQEDLFLTGLCAQQKDVPLFHESTFIIDDPPSPPSWKTFSPLTTAHSVSPAILDQVWDEMTAMVLDSMFNTEFALNSTVLKRLKRRT